MLAILQFYVSSFWVWLGITIVIGIISNMVIRCTAIVMLGVVGASGKVATSDQIVKLSEETKPDDRP